MATLTTSHRGELIVDWRDETNKRHRERVADEETGYKRLAEIAATDKAKPLAGTLEEYGNWWLENHAKHTVKASTLEEYTRCLNQHVYPALGSKLLRKITPKMIRELIISSLTKNDPFSLTKADPVVAVGFRNDFQWEYFRARMSGAA